jgi:hypothetical protein
MTDQAPSPDHSADAKPPEMRRRTVLRAVLTSGWLAGGLAGAVVSFGMNSLREWWLRPQLQVLFDNAEPGCRVDTNVAGGTEPILSWVRLKVRNSGRSTARGVSVYLTKLTFKASGVGEKIFDEDVIDLHLAYKIMKPINLAPGAHRYFDLAYVSKSDLSFSYDFAPWENPVRLRERGFGTAAGTFGAEVFVSADNAEATGRFVTWSWDGKFPGLDIVGNKPM